MRRQINILIFNEYKQILSFINHRFDINSIHYLTLILPKYRVFLINKYSPSICVGGKNNTIRYKKLESIKTNIFNETTYRVVLLTSIQVKIFKLAPNI